MEEELFFSDEDDEEDGNEEEDGQDRNLVAMEWRMVDKSRRDPVGVKWVDSLWGISRAGRVKRGRLYLNSKEKKWGVFRNTLM